MGASINIKDVPLGIRKQLRGKLSRQQQFSAEQTRKWSIKVLNTIAELNQQQRKRVLGHALKLNKV